MRENWDRRARRDAFYYVETAHWDGDIEGFFALGEERARTLIDPVVERLAQSPEGSSALDLGCGLGRFSRALARRFRDVLGVDVSAEMVARARELNPEHQFPNLRFEAGDGLRLPASTASADFVWSYEVFQHMPTLEVIRSNLAEVGRVLSPGGMALIHLRTADEGGGLRTQLGRLLPDSVARTTKRALGRDGLVSDRTFRGTKPVRRDELPALLASAGLNVTEVRADPTHAPGSRAFVVASPG
jgi:SAM-dependent methyltransferase